ncbi:hypothetical protein EDB87DRAFT_1154928 [Lactarius vividus]|nr:hypothetical protein EDB87DRAFT_1154928 [Lactarius vividus]
MRFFNAHLLRICIERGFPSETLHLMRIKMARRLSELGSAVSDGVCQVVHDIAQETEELLQNRWTSFQKSQSTSPPWNPYKPGSARDTAITLNNSRPYITEALDSSLHSYSPMPFNPSHQPRFADTTDFLRFSDGRLKEAVANDGRIALADFESFVERYLDSWVYSFPLGDDPPDIIASCVEQYFASATDIYKANPEENSVMILTVMDLWKALDTLTIRRCSLLQSYSPEFSSIPYSFIVPVPYDVLNSEKYILRRHGEASCATSIFSDHATKSSFAVRYYDDSPQLQRLYNDSPTCSAGAGGKACC